MSDGKRDLKGIDGHDDSVLMKISKYLGTGLGRCATCRSGFMGIGIWCKTYSVGNLRRFVWRSNRGHDLFIPRYVWGRLFEYILEKNESQVSDKTHSRSSLSKLSLHCIRLSINEHVADKPILISGEKSPS